MKKTSPLASFFKIHKINKFYWKISLVLLVPLLFFSCEKEMVVIDGNQPVSTFNISKIKIENYVQRIFIDIIGREPLEEEMIAHVALLQADSLKRDTRMDIIQTLMNDTSFRAGEGSYKAAYILNLYNLAKIRCVEGAPDGEFNRRIGLALNGAFRDSLEGNWDGYYEKHEAVRKFRAVLKTKDQLYEGKIGFHQMFGAMINNGVYDVINMNTFNFVRAAFDELLWRLPTEGEFQASFTMIEHEEPAVLFGKAGSNKEEFVDILIHSPAMYEGLVIWAFQIYLKRPPTPTEVVTFLPEFVVTKDINFIISEIMVTDEYANFR
nr:hypothetical protein [Saprospiraceae bacterium]